MGDKFQRIKRAARLLLLAKVLAVGLSVGLLAAGGLLLLRRFSVWETTVTVCVALSVGLGALTAMLAWLLLRRNDKGLAVWLDEHHGLAERMQTVLAFEGEDSPMLTMLRADAETAIEAVGKTVPGMKRFWVYILCLVLAASLFGTSFVWKPAPPPPPPPVEEVPFRVSELQLMALSELIASVEGSAMAEPYRAETLAVLNTLYTDIQEVETETAKDECVGTAMADILSVTDRSSPAVELMNALWGTGTTGAKLLAKALNYYENDDWDKIDAALTDFRLGFTPVGEGDDPTEEQLTAELQNSFLAVAQNITLALKSGGVAEDSLLYTVLTRLAVANEKNADGTRVYGLLTLAEYTAAEGHGYAERELESTMMALSGDLHYAVSLEEINTKTGEGAISTLSTIFDVQAPAFKRPLLTDVSEDGGYGEGGGGGGGISGGPSYGSGDKVYDPFTNRYVEYGVILDKYYGMMFGKLNGGAYTDEEKAALEEYFRILYGGFEEKENEN